MRLQAASYIVQATPCELQDAVAGCVPPRRCSPAAGAEGVECKVTHVVCGLLVPVCHRQAQCTCILQPEVHIPYSMQALAHVNFFLGTLPTTPSAFRPASVQVLAYVKELDRPTQRLGRLAVDRVQQQRDRLLAATRAGLDDEPRTAIGGWSSSRIRVV